MEYLSALATHGLIGFRTAEGSTHNTYRVAELPDRSNVEHYKGWKSLSQEIYNVAKSLGDHEFTIQDIVRLVEDTSRNDKTRSSIRTYTSSVLKFFVENGYLVRTNTKVQADSVIHKDDAQSNIIDDIVRRIRGVQTQEAVFLEMGRNASNRIIANSETVYTLMERAYASSPNANALSPAFLKSCLLSLLSDQPLSTAQINSILNESHGILVGNERIRVLLRELSDSDQITRQKDNKQKAFWRVKKISTV